ncbi:hypothetical protein AGMMS49983_11740 [Clostridia bacterium]|nr:hypothetical protein AGMMS49983_11740 [Clostridia bacterium]
MSDKGRWRTAISVFLSFTILIALVCAVGILLLHYVVFDTERLKSRFDTAAIAGEAYGRLAEAFDSYAVSAGIGDAGGAFYRKVLTEERVKADVEAEILHTFDAQTPAPDRKEFHAAIDAEIHRTVKEQGIVLTEERGAALGYLSELCTEAYDKATSVPDAARLAMLAERVRESVKPFAIGGGLLFAASCLFLFALHPGRKRNAVLYISYGIISAGLFLLFWGA